ncbi:mannose-1-phosphate guanylyltransferase [Candidatus Gottesmanbacteria bacterium]|nr:mannose-1-phosphate guanylyltransferase [Candidatus Gottesmanbacteria bacterium]
MKAIIFAGGVGTRLWPLSRKNSPKQFEKVIGDKSTLQLAVERLLPDFGWDDIYISTSQKYIFLVKEQLPKIDISHIIAEPEGRDVGPAVGLAIANIVKKFPAEPLVILWSDHIVKNNSLFKKILNSCAEIISQNSNKLIFISQKPRFASQNLGWIEYGNKKLSQRGFNFYDFKSFNYRPDLIMASEFLKSGYHAWNIGYFVTTASFLWQLFKLYQPEMYKILREIQNLVGSDKYESSLDKLYKSIPKISFDNAILEKIKKEDAYVIAENLGWSDVGAWEALKEALQSDPSQNVTSGKVLVTDCRDTLVYNYTDQMVVTIDLDGYLVINTKDVVLVCHKNSVPKIKKLVENLADSKNEHLV